MISPMILRAALSLSLVAALHVVSIRNASAEKPAKPAGAEAILLKSDFLVACERGDAAAVRKLLQEGADPNATRSSGANALTYAVAGKHTEVVKLLLKAKADPNKTSLGLAPLFLASENGDLESVRLLLAAKADVNAPLHAVDEDMKVRNGDTALIASAAPGVPGSVARALLAAGADVNAQADNGKTAVMQAVAADNIEVLRILLGARPNLQAMMKPPEEIDALSLAVGKSSTDMVALLVNAGADVDVRIDGEVTLLEFAILSEQPQTAAILRKAGVKEPSKERLDELREVAGQP